MWQENDDSSNREIKNNYPEIWKQLMDIRDKGAISSDAKHQEIYGRVPYGFLYAYNPSRFEGHGSDYPNPNNTKLCHYPGLQPY